MSDPVRTWDADRLAKINAMVKRADAGDQEALTFVRQVFDTVPGLWDAYGDLARTAENALIELVAGESVLKQEAFRKKLAALRAELASPEASPVERLLAERVAICWLQSHHADLMDARSLQGHSFSEAEYYQGRQDRAARQYIHAMKSLVMVGRLSISPVQVNIAERQVNIAAQDVQVGKRD